MIEKEILEKGIYCNTKVASATDISEIFNWNLIKKSVRKSWN